MPLTTHCKPRCANEKVLHRFPELRARISEVATGFVNRCKPNTVTMLRNLIAIEVCCGDSGLAMSLSVFGCLVIPFACWLSDHYCPFPPFKIAGLHQHQTPRLYLFRHRGKGGCG
jgi:hypothetical protein